MRMVVVDEGNVQHLDFVVGGERKENELHHGSHNENAQQQRASENLQKFLLPVQLQNQELFLLKKLLVHLMKYLKLKHKAVEENL